MIVFRTGSLLLWKRNGNWLQVRLPDQAAKMSHLHIVNNVVYVLKDTNVRIGIHKRKRNFLRQEKQQRVLMTKNFLKVNFALSFVIRSTHLIIGRCVDLLTDWNNLSVKFVSKLGMQKPIVQNRKKKLPSRKIYTLHKK